MPLNLVLASSSESRARLIRKAGLSVSIHPARIDEESLRQALMAENASSRDIADALAETKALKVSIRYQDAMVVGADQILDLNGKIFNKPVSPQDAVSQLTALSGKTHKLLSALVVVSNGQPMWRYVGQARLTMNELSPRFIAAYVERNWHMIQNTAGCYLIEAEGIRLFSEVEGDIFTIQGFPLTPFLNWLHVRGDIQT